MYTKTGAKIKRFAATVSSLGIGLCLAIGGALFFVGVQLGFVPSAQLNVPEWIIPVMIVSGLIVSIFGSILFWLQNLLLAGYGELIEETSKSAAELKEIKELLQKK